MDPFVAQLARLCRDHPTRAKWVFVPTHAIGRTLGDRLVLAGTDWANLRLVTPLEIALRMGAPFLVERGIDPSEEGLGPALIMRLLLELPASHTYFRPLANQPAIAAALWQTIRELRMAGVQADRLAAEGFVSADKCDELRALLGAYEAYLTVERRGDRQTVFAEAVRHLDWCPIGAADCWTWMPDVAWSPIERELIARMPGERIVPEALALPTVEIPRRLAEMDVTRVDPSAVGPDGAASLAYLMAPASDGRARRTETRAGTREPQALGHKPSAVSREPALSLFRAGGPEAEIEEVFRRIVAAKGTLDAVEISCPADTYTTLIWEKACRYDWPVTLATGLPVTLTRPGRALVALAEWIEDDFAAGLLRRLLESGDVRFGDDMTLTPARAARLLVRAQAAWGRRTYRLSLGRLARSARTRADRDDVPEDERESLRRRAGEAEALAGWIDATIGSIPEPSPDGLVDLQTLATAARQFLSTAAARASALDAAAIVALCGSLDELGALGAFRCPPAQALRFLRERVEGLSVGADRARPGHLHVSPLSQAGFSCRQHLFVAGLEEGRVFPGGFEDPVLLDRERAGIDDSLRRSADRIDEAVYAVLARLAAVSADPGVEICLSYSCRDLRQFRETYASWLMLQAYRLICGNPSAPFQQLHAHLGNPVSCVPPTPEAALSEGRWWLRSISLAGGAAGRAAVLARHPALASGVRAAEARASDRFTEFDGYVPEAGAPLDPCAPGRVVSPTRLESAAKCPFRFFLERGLQVTAIEAGERDRDVWLDPLIRGSLLHDLYARLLRRCRGDRRRASLDTDRAWLLGEGHRVLDELKREMPPPSVDVEARERQDLMSDLDLFLEGECEADAARTPIGFEVSFGQADAVDDEPLASAVPVAVEAGGLTFRIAGRIDRIDRIDPIDRIDRIDRAEGAAGRDAPAFQIVDYKTGTYWASDWVGTFGGGRMLQHALYGLAVTNLLREAKQNGRVVAAEYYFSAAKGRLERRVIPTPAAADLAGVLGDLREVIASGLFVHTPKDRPCKFCDLQHACGAASPEQAAAKMADPILAPFRRLADRA